MVGLSSLIRNHIDSKLSQLYTCLPGYITRVKTLNGAVVVDVQPGINDIDSVGRAFEEDIIEDIPVMWPGGNGCSITFPVKEGDEVMLHFSMRCAANWKDSAGDKPNTPYVRRLHALPDAFATLAYTTLQPSLEIDSEAVRISSGATEIRILQDGTIELGEGAVEQLALGGVLLDYLTELATRIKSVDASTPLPIDWQTTGYTPSPTPRPILSEVSKTK